MLIPVSILDKTVELQQQMPSATILVGTTTTFVSHCMRDPFCQHAKQLKQLPHTDMFPLWTVQHPSPAALVLHLHTYPRPVAIVQDLTLLPMTISSRKLSQQMALHIL